MVLESVEYLVGDIITLRKTDMKYLQIDTFFDCTWFRPKNSVLGADGYGSKMGFYYVNSPLKLINLGSTYNRMHIADQVFEKENRYRAEIDEQYSGHGANMLYHRMLMEHDMSQNFDGTIMQEQYCDNEDFVGADEIVLFKRSHSKIGLVRTLKLDGGFTPFDPCKCKFPPELTKPTGTEELKEEEMETESL